MFRVVIPAILAVALTACGGGGGGGGGNTPPVVEALQFVASIAASEMHMSIAKFTGGDTQHLVMAGLKHLGAGRTEPAPVKVYQLADNGTMIDATVSVLGGATTVSTNSILIADFNRDGIDDLFLPGFSDTQDLLPSVAFISRPGQSHIRVDLPDPVWAHGATVIDANNDGNLDVMSAWGEIWFNDGQGNFRFQTHTYQSTPGFWIHGSGICVGDFNNTGSQQVVLTDQNINSHSGPIADTVIFELGPTGLPVAQHYLPVPVLDRNSTTVELSHDVTCRTADINNDGLLDILVFSRPWALAGGSWTNQGVIQTLINRGNWQFEDTTDVSMSSYNSQVLVSYTARLLDLNNDGKIDIWASYFDWNTGNSNQVLLNNGTGIFTPWQATRMQSFGASGGMIPVKFGNQWAFVVSRINNNSSSNLYMTRPVYSFQ